MKLPTGYRVHNPCQIQGSFGLWPLPFHSASGSPGLIPNGSLPLSSILGVFHFLKAEAGGPKTEWD